MESDPTPGDPERVRELSEELQTFADDVGEALGRVRGMAGDRAVLNWAGLSAEAFRAEFDGVPDNLDKLRTSYDMAADALARYWPALQSAQATADRALDRALAAQTDLTSAQAALGDAQDWVTHAGEEAERLQDERPGDAAEPPSESEVRGAVRDHQAAQAAAATARTRVADAEERLIAARELAVQARETREEAARECARDLDAASDAGIHNRRWWERAIDWAADNWDTLVEVCRIVVAVLGVVVLIIGGPLAWVVLAAALVVLTDTLIRYARGQCGLLDVAFAAMDCIPGGRGLTTLGGLARGARGMLAAARTGIRGAAQGARGLGRRARESAVEFGRRHLSRDPVDLATGVVVMPATDVELPGVLPLTMERHHLSDYRSGRWFGPSWASSLDQRLELRDAGVRFHSADGMTLEYPVPLSGLATGVLPVEGPRWTLSWDGLPGSSMSVHQPENGHTLHFSSVPGHPGAELLLTAVTDRNENRLDLRYDADGAPQELAHSGGYRLGIATTRGRVTELTLLSDPDGPSLVRYGYDTAGDLSRVYNSSGIPQHFAYDSHHRMTRWQDRGGNWYRYDYDAEGRCVFATGTDRALEYRYTYDPAHHRTTCTDALDNTTTYQFNDCFQLIAETDPLGNTTLHTHDRYDRTLTTTDPLGAITVLERDDEGRVTTVVRPDGARLRATYNELGLPESVVEADGSEWLQSYDQAGNRTVLLDPLGNRTRFGYDGRGALVRVTDAEGNTSRIRTDPSGLPVAVTDPLGEVTRVHRDAFGRPALVIDPLGGETRLTWTVEGKPRSRTDPLGHEELWEWDAEVNLASHTGPSGDTVRYTYGPFDQPTSRTGPDGVRHSFTRDAELRLTRVTDPEGRSWQYVYDAAGRMVSETDFDGRSTTYSHDAAGRTVSRTNAAGQSVTYTYDAQGELTGWSSDDGRTTAYVLDPLGRVTRATSPGTELERVHDPLGNLLSETVNGRTLSLTYDALGRVTSRTTPSGHTSTWTYDAVGQVVSLDSLGHTMDFEHDPLGRETACRVGESLDISQQWDPAGRLTGLTVAVLGSGASGRVLHQRRYGYRADGCLTSLVAPSGTTRYTLDPAGRVTAVQAPGWAELYAYDTTGNQTTGRWNVPGLSQEAVGERSYTGALLTQAGAVRYEYDAAGRVTLRQRKHLSRPADTWRYTWDAEDRLTSVAAADGSLWRYHYDPFGRRVAKERLATDGATVEERVDFTWWLLSLVEQTTSGSEKCPPPVTLTWDYRGLRPVAQTERGPAPEEPGIRQDLAAAGQAEIDERFFAIVTDLVGAPTHLVTDTGDVAWESRATLWGSTVAAPGNRTTTPLRFPGQYADEESGWHYNHQRHYDPATARYATQDPLGLAPAPNPYTYPHNPHIWADPLGLAPYRISRRRYRHLDRPGYSNYMLRDRDGNAYYSGMFGPRSSSARAQRRHGRNHNRFSLSDGDTMDVQPGIRTYGESRLMEQRLMEQNGTYIGRDGDNYRGNRQNPLDGDRMPEYEAYEHRKKKNLGSP
ncbi:DUF6531 domain-containing protein [Streptomyces avicenniae]|uniref:DUF6531 domain-containing protein n=1 Tax=Streptomyces avicenniae TaxID=500153 RepID=UPI00069C7900|nr:DUF6531 domain-containing protein [Streptomyces avicenniae]